MIPYLADFSSSRRLDVRNYQYQATLSLDIVNSFQSFPVSSTTVTHSDICIKGEASIITYGAVPNVSHHSSSIFQAAFYQFSCQLGCRCVACLGTETLWI